jgi:hypothetical protein
MDSEYFARHRTIPLDKVDMMLCIDLLGHAIGGAGLSEAVAKSVFALGAERSDGTAAVVDEIASAVPGVQIRRADVEIVPPLSDYHAWYGLRAPGASRRLSRLGTRRRIHASLRGRNHRSPRST